MTEKNDCLTDALARIMTAVGRIEKKGTAPAAMGGFRFVRETDVVEALQEALAAERVILSPRVELLDIKEAQTSSGKIQWLPIVRLDLYAYRSGEEMLLATTVGQGQDTSDKGISKAITSAKKQALLIAFMVPTGDDTEAYSHEESVSTRAASQKARPDVRQELTEDTLRYSIAVALKKRGRDHDYLERVAESIGAGKPATREQLAEMLKLVEEGFEPIEQPASVPTAGPQESVSESQASGGQEASGSGDAPAPPAELTVDQIMEAAGPGAEMLSLEPPKPGTTEYDALKGKAKADATRYWVGREQAA